MNNFGALCRYEWKKLWSKRIVRITLIFMILMQIFANLTFLMENNALVLTDSDGKAYVTDEMNGYEIMAEDKKNARAIGGRAIDQSMLNDMILSNKENLGEMCKPYDEVTVFARNVIGWFNWSHPDKPITEEGLYMQWKENISEKFQSDYLREDEVAYWEETMEKIETPFVYEYHTAWKKILDMALTINILVLMGVAICLSTIFSDEHRGRTDQLVLCTRNGRKQVYLAKLTVGIGLSVMFALLLYLVSFVIVFAFWGMDGFGSNIQLCVQNVPYQISVGQGVLLLLSITILAVVLESVYALFLSEKMNNGVAVMAVLVGIMLFSQLVDIPAKYRGLSQMYSYIPTRLLAVWNFSDTRLIKIAGSYLTNFQFAAILYLVLSIILIILGYKNYKSYEVSGR